MTGMTFSEADVAAFLRTVDWEVFWKGRALSTALERVSKLAPPPWVLTEGFERVGSVMPVKGMRVHLPPAIDEMVFVRFSTGMVATEQWMWDLIGDLRSGPVYLSGTNVYFGLPEDWLTVSSCMG